MVFHRSAPIRPIRPMPLQQSGMKCSLSAWPRIDFTRQNRAHGVLYMRASRRGRTITTISVVVEQSWFSLAVGSHPLHPPSVRLHWIKRLEDRWIGPSHPSTHEWCGNTTARMHARAACQRSPARGLDQTLHNSDRPWTHVNNVPRHDARAASPRELGSSSRRCWTTAACWPSATPESRWVIMPPSARFVMCHFPEGLSDGRPLFFSL